MLGSKTIVTTMLPEETDEIKIGPHSLWGWYPTTARKRYSMAENKVSWYITHTGGGFPLSWPNSEISSDAPLVIYLKKDEFIPEKLYRAMEQIAGKSGYVWLVTVDKFTLSQSPVIYTCYQLSEMPEGEYSYVHFVCEDGQSIQVECTDEPERLVKSEWFPGEMSEAEVIAKAKEILTRLPENYPPATFTKEATGYALRMEDKVLGKSWPTTIFHSKPGDEALERVERYVAERDRSPNLPVGVVDGIYD